MASITAAAGGGNWTTGATWVGGSSPGTGDDALLTSASGNVTIDSGGAVCRSLNCATYVGTLTHNSSSTLTVGDGTTGHFTLVAGMTYTIVGAGSSAIAFVSTTTGNQITTAGKTTGPITFNGAGGAWTLQDALTVGASADLTLTAGTLNTNNVAVTSRRMLSTNSNVRALTLGTTTWTLAGSGSSDWEITIPTNMTLSAASSTIVDNFGGGGFRGGGLSYGTVRYTGTGTCTITGSNTFINFERSNAAACTLSITSATTQTITGTLTLSGTAGNLVTLTTTAAGIATISKTSGTVSEDYMSITKSTASGGASFYAGANSTDGGTNTGWVFTAPPVGSTLAGRAALLGVGA